MTIIQPLTNPPSKDKMSYLSLPHLFLFPFFFFNSFSSSNYTHIDHNLIDIPKLYYPRNETSPLSLSLSLSSPSTSSSIFFFLFFFLFFFHFVVAWHQCLSRRKTSPRGIEMRGQFKIKIFQLRRDFSEERRGGGN